MKESISLKLDHPDLFSDDIEKYLILLRDLTWKILQNTSEHNSLKKRFGGLVQEGYPSTFQLPYAYLALIASLLNLPSFPITPYQMPNGAACMDVGNIQTSWQIPELIQSAELGSLWMVLGVRLKQETLTYAGLRLALWQLHTLDHKGIPLASLWARASSFNPLQLATYNELLFSLAYRITSLKKFQQAAESQNISRDSLSLTTHLFNLVPDTSYPNIQFSPRFFPEEVTLGFIKFTTPQSSIACTLSGMNSGFFSFHKNGVAILNAGPQVDPLDASEYFGIERKCLLRGKKFQEVLWEKSAYHFRLKGWTRIFALPIWMQLDCVYQAQKIILKMHFQEEIQRKNFNLSFYCQAEKILIGGKTLLESGTLDKYQGKAVPLELSTQDEVLYIEPSPGSAEEQILQVIPLAGGSHFWGAQFLVTISLNSPQNIFHYTFK